MRESISLMNDFELVNATLIASVNHSWFEQFVEQSLQSSPGAIALFRSAWQEALLFQHWNHPDISIGAAAARSAVENRFPQLHSEAISALIEAAAYQWR
jgi:hypothetical protein